MQINHIHLHVRDLGRAQFFYETWLGFHEHVRHGSILFLRNEDDFDLALAPDEAPTAFPRWFHFGCRQPTAQGTITLYERMENAGVDLRTDLYQDETLVSFRCADPDGYQIENYWE